MQRISCGKKFLICYTRNSKEKKENYEHTSLTFNLLPHIPSATNMKILSSCTFIHVQKFKRYTGAKLLPI